jgi:hypothetical protein
MGAADTPQLAEIALIWNQRAGKKMSSGKGPSGESKRYSLDK